MLDVAVSYNRYKYLGYEFLTWLWFSIETQPQRLASVDADMASLDIGNRIVLEKRKKEAVESITIKGDDAGLEEGLLALKKGALVTELNLTLKSGDQEWKFTVKGESLDLSGFKPPQTGPVETTEDIEGAVIERAYLYERALTCLDRIYADFIQLRRSDDWLAKTVPQIRTWLAAAGA